MKRIPDMLFKKKIWKSKVKGPAVFLTEILQAKW